MLPLSNTSAWSISQSSCATNLKYAWKSSAAWLQLTPKAMLSWFKWGGTSNNLQGYFSLMTPIKILKNLFFSLNNKIWKVLFLQLKAQVGWLPWLRFVKKVRNYLDVSLIINGENFLCKICHSCLALWSEKSSWYLNKFK